MSNIMLCENDVISSKFLRIGGAPLAALISDIVNMSVSECTFPDILKYYEKASLFKRLKIIDPFCIYSTVKIYENVFNIQKSQYFGLTKFPSGVRHKYNCQATLVRMIEEWKEALDNGKMLL